MEYDEVRRDQRERFALRVEALEHPDGGAIVRHVDVTARHQARIEIEEQRRQLSHLARVASLGLLSGALAHELNQPLASIGSNAEAARILLKRRTADMQGLDDILRDIITENYRAAEVIHRLRALLRRGETRLQPLNTTELISEVLELAHAELITRRVTVTSVVDPNLPAVLGDRVQLQQVLLNLILNACEAMRATPLRERRLWVVASVVGTSTQISIRDSGTAIPAALIDRRSSLSSPRRPRGSVSGSRSRERSLPRTVGDSGPRTILIAAPLCTVCSRQHQWRWLSVPLHSATRRNRRAACRRSPPRSRQGRR
jgi:C4-dicarboxylate-specific signal transduction histidine kinase